MAKRVRYSGKSARRSRPARSGADRPARDAARDANAAARPAPAPPLSPSAEPGEMPIRSSGHLTEDEVRRAAELETEQAARERAAIADALRRRSRSRGHEAGAGVDVNAPLSVRAAHEYAYVARDVRRIALTGGLVVGILAVLHVLVNVLGVISI